jgi:hypothetical protein
VYSYGPQYEFYSREHEPNCWGHSQVNYGISLLVNDDKHKVDIITVQDDDDIYTLTAFDIIRDSYVPNTLMMARIFNQAHGLLWREPRWGVPLSDDKRGKEMLEVGISALDGHCVFFPGNTKHIPKYDNTYVGDQAYVNQSSIFFPKVMWLEAITTITRPTETFELTVWPTKIDHKTWYFYKEPTCETLLGSCAIDKDDKLSIAVKDKKDNDTIRQILSYMSISSQRDLIMKTRTDGPEHKMAVALGWESYGTDDTTTSLQMLWPPMELVRDVLYNFHNKSKTT